MKTKANMRIRTAANQYGVMLWEIAERIGINDSNFSRKLRRELPEDDQQKIIEVIKDIAHSKEV
jgi:hypothetical protein